MTPWQWIKNNIPPYAEEIQINQVEETLNQFKQLIPNGFVELKQLNWMCSTQGWKEPVCERYNSLINGEWKQVDISHTLLEKLELREVNNISYPVYISPVVLDRGLDHYFAYNVEDETEIFLEKSFTVENLEEDIDKLFKKIEELEGEKEKLENDWQNRHQQELEKKDNEITRLRNQIIKVEAERDARTDDITLDQWNNDYKNRPTRQELNNLQTQLNSVQQQLQRELQWWNNWMNEKNKSGCGDSSKCDYSQNINLLVYFYQGNPTFLNTLSGDYNNLKKAIRYLIRPQF